MQHVCDTASNNPCLGMRPLCQFAGALAPLPGWCIVIQGVTCMNMRCPLLERRLSDAARVRAQLFPPDEIVMVFDGLQT